MKNKKIKTTIYDLPSEIMNYMMVNLFDSDDIKKCLKISKMFNVLTEQQLKVIKKAWLEKYFKHVLKLYYQSINGYSGRIDYDTVYDIKNGPYTKTCSYEDRYESGYKSVSCYYKNDKLHGKYSLECGIWQDYSDPTSTFNYLTGSYSLTNYKKVKALGATINFKHGKITNFEITYKGKEITSDSEHKDKIISLLELPEKQKNQLCEMLNANKNTINVNFLYEREQ